MAAFAALALGIGGVLLHLLGERLLLLDQVVLVLCLFSLGVLDVRVGGCDEVGGEEEPRLLLYHLGEERLEELRGLLVVMDVLHLAHLHTQRVQGRQTELAAQVDHLARVEEGVHQEDSV